MTSGQKFCSTCGNEKTFKFNRWRCRSCQLKSQRKHYLKNHKEEVKKRRERSRQVESERYQLIIAAKNVPCMDCGGIFPHYAMDFDHISGDKIGNVSQMLGFNLERLLNEIAKCDIVCSNCHRIRTWIRLH